jgi:thioredoxin 1
VVQSRLHVAALFLAIVVSAGCGSGVGSLATTPRSVRDSVPSSSAPIVTTAGTPTPGPGVAYTYDPSRNARADIAAALGRSNRDHKYVLIDFGADWCLDCQVLGHLYAVPEVSAVLAIDYHVVTVDVGQFDRNVDLSNQYGGVIEAGIPALVILNPAGKVIVATKNGAFSNARTMTSDQVRAFLARWSPHLA